MMELKNISIHQGAFRLENINMEIGENQYATLMGRTGCGKTTLIELICGLRNPKSGSIKINNCEVNNLNPARRGIGYVPQDLALFPKMTVNRQIEFGMRARKMSSDQIQARVEEVCSRLQLDSIRNRYPRDLSGGEKQRVAIGRALAFRPQLLCLDEPLSSLDKATWESSIELLDSVFQVEKTTVLHITHNRSEAERLGTVHFQFLEGQVVSGLPL